MIHCQDTAFKNYMNKLYKKGIQTTPLKEFNHGRHKLIKTNKGELLYLVFKRDFFNTFSKEFPQFDCLGESINKEFLDVCLLLGVSKIVFLHPNKDYFTYPMLVRNFCDKNNLLRLQDKVNHYKGLNGYLNSKKELTYSFPITLLEEE